MNIKNSVAHWGGAAFMLGGLLFLGNKLDEMSRLFLSRSMGDVISGDDTLLIIIGQVAFIIGYVGFWRLYRKRVGRMGSIALALFCTGGIVLALGHSVFISSLADLLPSSLAAFVEYLFLLVVIGLLLLIIGLIWFGVLNLRHPVLARWQWLPLATAIMGFVGFFLFSGEEITAVFLIFRTLFALGLIGLGAAMWLDRSVQHTPYPGQQSIRLE